MKILLLAPIHDYDAFYEEKSGQPFVSYQGQQGWCEALLELGHEVVVFRYTDTFLIPRTIAHSVRKIFSRIAPHLFARYNLLLDKCYYINPENWIRNFKIMKVAEKMHPNLVIFSGGSSSVFPSTFRKLKEKFACKEALLSGVNPATSITPAEKKIAQVVDVVVTNDSGYQMTWKKMGAQRATSLPISAINPRLHKKSELTKKELNEYNSDVCFVGSLTKDRQEKLKYLLQKKSLEKITCKIWGDLPGGLALDDALLPYYHGTAHGEKMVRIFNATTIALNFQPADMKDGGNMRTFEIAGCGAFELADGIREEWFKNGEEYVKFESIEDLEKKILYYLGHEKERKQIATKGYKRTIKNHTYKERFAKLIQLLS